MSKAPAVHDDLNLRQILAFAPRQVYALGQKRTLKRLRPMSALPPKADIADCDCDVRFVPKADSCTAAIDVRSSAAPSQCNCHIPARTDDAFLLLQRECGSNWQWRTGLWAPPTLATRRPRLRCRG